jgi:exosortase
MKDLPALEQRHGPVDLSTSVRQEIRERHHGWLQAGVFSGAIVAALVGLYAHVLPGWLKDLWRDPNYSHAYIVPIISGFVIWQRRRALIALPIQGSWRGVLPLLAGVAAVIVGDISASQFLMRISLIIVLAGLVLFHFGSAVLRRLAFPLSFLVFLVPMPLFFIYAITARLQHLAAWSGAWALDLLGVAVFLEGNVIQLRSLALGVTEACSGIRSLMTLVALGVAWAHLMLPRFWMQVVLVTSVVPIAIAANAGRIVMTGLVGQSFGVEYAEGFFHFFSGWLVFIVALLGLLGVHAGLRAVSPRQDWGPA